MKSFTIDTHSIQSHGVIGNDDNSNELHEDLVLLIMSFLTMKQAAATSLVSSTWNSAWHSLPVLSFQLDSFPTIKKKFGKKEMSIELTRSDFTKWVNSVMEAHIGSTIDEFRVIFFDLDVKCEYDIDKWLVFALSKHVKKLEFNFFKEIPMSTSTSTDFYSWPIEERLSYLGLHCKLASLKSLCLKSVNVTSQDIECILLYCNVLEDLCIAGGGMHLTDVKLSHKTLQLKHLEVSYCLAMLSIDILAPKLVSLTYHGHPIKLHIRDASLLSKVSIGGGKYFMGEILTYVCSYLTKYFSQLEHLSWHLSLFDYKRFKCNMGINNPPVMQNLKHLVLHVEAMYDDTLLGWASFIEASPVLDRLTLEFSGMARAFGSRERILRKRHVSPLRSLKTLEIVDFWGLTVELEFVNFVVENSVSLEQVILLPCRTGFAYVPTSFLDRKLEIIGELYRKLTSQGVHVYKLYNSNNNPFA